MLLELDQLEPLFCCPRTRAGLVRDGIALRCVDDDRCSYTAVRGAPVLVDFTRSILCAEQVSESRAGKSVERRMPQGIEQALKRLLSPGKRNTRRNIDRLIAALPHDRDALVLVIGGATVGQGIRALYDHPRLRIAAFDIRHSPNVQFIADAHSIPLHDGSVDAVVIQTALEHALDPQQVVDEIWRVLKPRGLVYAETPFLQHAHGGGHDFTRFTESRHRLLFRRFELIDSGVSGGPGSQLACSIDCFARALFRSRLAGKICKLAFSWLRLFDPLLSASQAPDMASGVYFLGKRSSEAVSPQEIIAFYRGAQANVRGVAHPPAMGVAHATKSAIRSVFNGYQRVRLSNALGSVDHLLVSYPKSGRTWFRYILSCYIAESAGLTLSPDLSSMFQFLPNLDWDKQRGLPAYYRGPAARAAFPLIAVTHHLPGKGRLPATPVIFMIRDPRDVLVSRYYHATRHKHAFSGDISAFLRDPAQGLPAWVDHTNDWMAALANRRHLIVSYESLSASTSDEVRRVLTFLGQPVDEARLVHAVAAARIDRMRALEIRNGIPGHRYDRGDPQALRARRGVVGGYRDDLSQADLDWIYRYNAEHLGATASHLLASLLPDRAPLAAI